MSTLSLDALPAKFGERSFKVPRAPIIRISALQEVYPNGLYIPAVDDIADDKGRTCFSRGSDITIPLKFVLEEFPGGSGIWATAPIGDFILNRVEHGQTMREGYIYIGPTKNPADSLFTLYVSTSAAGLTTTFGKFLGEKTKPEPFANDGENYFWDMSDAYGNWLWGYRLYAPHRLG